MARSVATRQSQPGSGAPCLNQIATPRIKCGVAMTKPDSAMDDHSNYTVSIDYDRRLYRQDIAGSKAHAAMLAKQGIIAEDDADAIIHGLTAVQEEIERGDFPWDPALEDLHMNIESRLTDLIGPAGARLHTGRSRNDQIALDMRLYTRAAIADTVAGLRSVQRALVDLAERYVDVVMPGYTHLQRAQPVLFAHHMLAYFEMLERDVGRFADCARPHGRAPAGQRRAGRRALSHGSPRRCLGTGIFGNQPEQHGCRG